MAWGLAAADATDALLAIAENIPNIDRADGPKFTATQTLALVIGYSDRDVNAIEHALGDIGYSSEQEDRFTVTCRAEALVNTSVSTARRAAYGLLATFAGFVNADPTLGVDAVTQAWITDVAYAPIQNERGYLATVRFGVTSDAFTGI